MPSREPDSRLPAVKVPQNTRLLAFWLMLMNPPIPARRGPNLLTLRLPSRSASARAEEGQVESAAVVEIKLVRLIDDGVGIDRGAEIQPSGRNSADHSGLGGEGNEIDDLLLIGHIGHAFGHANSQVDHAVGLQLERRPARDHLARR